MPASIPGAIALAAVALVALTGCDGAEDPAAEAEPPGAVQEGPVAATAVVPGDCLNGVVLGAAERREIESARVVACDEAHGIEVFATFELGAEALEVEDLLEYPGPARVVRAADEGCRGRIEQLVEDPDVFGLIALWPSEVSWATGDRRVACAVYSPDGTPFEERQL
jgi:hypothetical protein